MHLNESMCFAVVLMKAIFNSIPLLLCSHTEVACSSIAPPGGHSLLCCYISISLAISFQLKRPVLLLFLSCDLVSDSLSLSLFLHNLKLSVSSPFIRMTMAYSPVPLLLHCSVSCQDFPTISNFDYWICLSLSVHSFQVSPLHLLESAFSSDARLKSENDFTRFQF